jgi:hypothetical protein
MRRHTIGLTPSSQTLICTKGSPSEATGAGCSSCSASFDRRPDYHLPRRSARAPHTSSCSPHRRDLARFTMEEAREHGLLTEGDLLIERFE